MVNVTPKALVLSQNIGAGGASVRYLLKKGVSATHVRSSAQALEQVAAREIDLLIVDIPVAAKGKAREWARLAQQVAIPVLLLFPGAGGHPVWPEAEGRVVVLRKPVAWERVWRAAVGLLAGDRTQVTHREGLASPLAAGGRSKALSRRELQVLTLLAQGNANRAIAAEMTISEPTVKKHVQRIVAVREGLVGGAA